MRSARTLFASAATVAALMISAPAASALGVGEWEPDNGSNSSSEATMPEKDHGKEEHDKEEHDKKEHDKSWKDRKPHGGVHAGGGALARVDDPSADTSTGGEEREMPKDEKREDWKKDKEHEKSWEHKKPHGGVHTGGGALSVIGDWDPNSTSSGSSEQEKSGKEEEKSGKEQEKPAKGEESWKSEHEKSWKDDHEKSWEKKPHGGVHTGGGATAVTGSGVAAGSALLLGGLAVAGYRLRRRNGAGSAAA